jgi:hypothetical protein
MTALFDLKKELDVTKVMSDDDLSINPELYIE